MTGANSTADDKRLNFVLVEHACLQEKIQHASSDLYRTETIIPLAIGLFYAWLYGGEGPPRQVPAGLVWIPVAMILYGALRQALRYKALRALHQYVQDIEREFYGPKIDGAPSIQGWETRWLAKKWNWRAHELMRAMFWVLLLLITAWMAVAFHGGHATRQVG